MGVWKKPGNKYRKRTIGYQRYRSRGQIDQYIERIVSLKELCMLKQLKKIKNMGMYIQKFHKYGNRQTLREEVGRDSMKAGNI